MFNQSLKKAALEIHGNAVERYNQSYEEMRKSCDALYNVRERALGEIVEVEVLINSIANKPKEFDKRLGEIKEHVLQFHQTKKYADAAYKEAIKSGAGILSGIAVGGVIAAAAPSAAMSIATTFGTATTGRAISTLSGVAAKKAALGWIGRMSGGIATKGVVVGSGLASGKALLAWAGPIGWGVTGALTAADLVRLTSKNKKISKEAIDEAKAIMVARETLRETTETISHLKTKTSHLLEELSHQTERAKAYKSMDYLSLSEEAQLLLGTLVNNTLSLAALLNQTVE